MGRAMICAIETAALKNNACRKKNAMDWSLTLRAGRQGVVSHMLPGLETMATILTTVHIRWHGFGLNSSGRSDWY